MAMLRFGNFRFAYKKLAKGADSELRRELGDWLRRPGERREFFSKLGTASIPVQQIDESKRWYLGYISGGYAKQDAITADALLCKLGRRKQKDIERGRSPDQIKRFRKRIIEVGDPSRFEASIDLLNEQVKKIDADIEKVQRRGLRNTSAYLSSDRLDVYVATSMREAWEYESASRFVRAVFSDPAIRGLRLVHFDPTLSYSRDRLDKGLIEGLMLNRARCTLYMVQETDTLGKDSELASTLAQGKPVIAFVPREEPEIIRARLRTAQLRFVRKRLMLLMAEGALDSNPAELGEAADFISLAATWRPLFGLVGEEEKEFLRSHSQEWRRARDIFARAESAYFDKRARTLTRDHPLAMQVHLESGVANGVLVARSARDCARLLVGLLTNVCDFSIEHEAGAHVLREKISQCPFRVVTDDPMLTNSFWDLYGNA